MNRYYPNLFRPIRIGNVMLKNRIIAAPTGMMDLTPDGRLTPYNVSYYELKAMGGAAVVTLGESITDTQTGESHNRQIHLDDPNAQPSLTHTVLAIQRSGALANIELSHGGKYGGLMSIAGEGTANRTAYGPSEEDLPTGEHVYEMSKEMILHIVGCFGRAAAMCKASGFDMVMVHAAHGWLFNQFLSPSENRRTDEFGGNLENRARFLLMALDEVRRAVGPGFPIELRMNGDDFLAGAMTREDYIELAQIVESKVDLINVSCGSHEAESLFVRTHPSMFLEHGCNVYLAEGIKKVVGVPVACVGGIHTPELAEEIIASGKADIVELGRALLADPYFPKKAMAGNAEDITPCLRCFACFENIVRSTVVRCAVNPVIGHELDVRYYQPRLTRRKKVLVIGGGPGGMQAAITAAQKGHDVTLCERGGQLGGALVFAESVTFKRELFDFAKCLERRLLREGVDVRLNTEADAACIRQMQPDAVIAAVGAQPVIPPIPGIDGENVLHAIDCEGSADRLGQSVVIVGGGLIGCELGIDLGMKGKDVTIVEMRESLAPDANSFHKMALDIELEKYVHPVVSTKVARITPEGVWGRRAGDEEIFLAANNVIIAAGMKPRSETVDALYDSAPEFYPIGDCVKAAQVLQAVQQGYFVAREL